MITYKVPGDMDKVTAEAFLKSRLPAREAERLLSEGKVRTLPLFRAVDRFAPLARGKPVKRQLLGILIGHNARVTHAPTPVSS